MIDVTYRGVVLYKAGLIIMWIVLFSSNSAFSLVTHFDALHCQSIHCGHLEQLAIVSPRLQHLLLIKIGRTFQDM